MSSHDSGSPLKRDHRHSQGSASVTSNLHHTFWVQRLRSKLAKLVFLNRINLIQLICLVGALFFIFCIVEMLYLPNYSSSSSSSSSTYKHYNSDVNFGNLSFLNELDFGEDVVIKFEPLKIVDNFQKYYNNVVDENGGSKMVVRFGYRKPKLALLDVRVVLLLVKCSFADLVFGDLCVDAHQIKMVTLATALLEIGYEIEVFTLEDGPVHAIWREMGVPLTIIRGDEKSKFRVDWLNYHGILVNSLKAVDFLSCLMQEPFKNVPLVWTIHERALATRLKQYVSSGQGELVDNWRKVFSRATVIVFSNHVLPMAYSVCDSGNYLVIPGSPEESCKADKQLVSWKDDFIVAIVGSQLSYRDLWLDHAFVLRALYRLLTDFSYSSSRLKIIIVAGDSSSSSSSIVETIALKLKYPNETVKHVAVSEHTDNVISSADLVIYGSFLEEYTFPEILLKAMCLGKPIIAPDLPTIRKYVTNGVNGYLFQKENYKVLTKILFQMVSNGGLSLKARNAASIGKRAAKNLMVSESVEGYASLLENILPLPSEVAIPRPSKNIPMQLKAEWRWHLFEAIADTHSANEAVRDSLGNFEKKFDNTDKESSIAFNSFVYAMWEEQEYIDMANMRKEIEEEELKDRTQQIGGTWDKVYRKVRRPDRTFHERDEGELERTGQPLCIYEPYFGVGTWPFLHHTSLYRGLGLSTKGRRPGFDDIDAPSRLPLLKDAYYQDVLGEYGAFFAIANRIDRIHKNAWIGFQSWRATAIMKSMSKTAERSLLDAIEARRHGDTLYFWARLDTDPRNPLKQDFWSFCDSINAGNCQFAFSEAMKIMYGLKHNLSSLPPMPMGEGTWSVMHSWVLPTKSFMEFAMFSRMFVDALDAKFYDSHWKTGRCYLSLSKDRHCYSRLLELLVNVWAYHSARRMVYVNPETGFMQEQHRPRSRRGQMWIKWFEFTTLKSMDEELAEAFDLGHTKERWLWPLTGEVFYQGIYEKERDMRIKTKEEKKQRTKERIRRLKKRIRQKVIGEYVKPPVEESNSTANSTNL
ncbi:hypothetical protein BUALT_Bualt19G0006800 [Buddleja alternifolia]|uniref:Glycosyl transferase family 1 domain-containing protein n=1 Tax=Buddleja alternifolia TaxID=168488 RepID=A0AAV6W484_9LAMI|nr:hypothetical protein BUALT_Bualt19G0006800 [Buddleja alternifolia]